MHLVPLLLYFLALSFVTGMGLWNLGFLSRRSLAVRVGGIVGVLVVATVLPGALRAPVYLGWLDSAGQWLAASTLGDTVATHTSSLTLWSVVMFCACVVAAVRLVTFRRGPSRHRVFYAWLSWLYVVALTAVGIKVALGVRPPPGPVEALGATAIAALFLVHRGNLAHLHRAARRAFDALVFGSVP